MKAKGQFVILQYVPSSIRDERINVGVILASKEANMIACEVIEDMRRVSLLFAELPPEFLSSVLKKLTETLGVAQRPMIFATKEEEFFGDLKKRVGEAFIITKPLPTRFTDFGCELDRLYEGYVDKPRRRIQGQYYHPRSRIVTGTRKALKEAKLENKFKPMRFEAFTIPFSTKNGYLHLIEPLSLYPGPVAYPKIVDDTRVLSVATICYYAQRINLEWEIEQPKFHALIALPPTMDDTILMTREMLSKSGVGELNFQQLMANPEKYLMEEAVINP